MSEISIGGRLLSVAKFVRQGATFADIGTDHAYLPVFLLLSGTVRHAVCSDINEGPLENAKKTALEYGVVDRVTLTLADGACGIEKYAPTDVAICGMGGELIARIIDDAPYLRTRGVRLILQAMSRQEVLREYLNSNGFSVVGEDYAIEAGKSYSVIAAEYTEATPDTNLCRVRYGTACHESAEAQKKYLCTKLKSKRTAYSGILSTGASDAGLCSDIEYIERLIKELDAK